MGARSPSVRHTGRLRPPAHSSTYLEVATLRDAAAIAALRTGAGAELTRVHGKGPWGGQGTERGVRFEMTRGVVYIVREGRRMVATLAISRRKPWAIDPAYFSASRSPLYLTSVAVAPDRQRKGIGRRCVEETKVVAADWRADALRLDAFDAVAGAGGFYASCGMREVGRVVYRRAPLVYFEWVF